MKPPTLRNYAPPNSGDKLMRAPGGVPGGETKGLPRPKPSNGMPELNNNQSIFPQIPQTMHKSQVVPLIPTNKTPWNIGDYSQEGKPRPLLPRRPRVNPKPLMSTFF